MAMQGMPPLGRGHPTTGVDCQERLDSSQETSKEMVDRFNHMKVGPDRSTDAAMNMDRSHFELTDSMSSYEVDSVEARSAQTWPSALLPSSEGSCPSCCARSLSSDEGTCTSCSARPLSSRESDSSFVVLRPNKTGIQRGGGEVSRQETKQADVQYKLSEDRGAGVDGIPLRNPREPPPPDYGDGQEQEGHQRQVPCDERRTNRVQNSVPITGKGGVQCRIQGDPKVEGGTSQDNALEGYSPLNTRDERGGGSPSVPTTGEVGDGLEQDRHRRQVSCDARRTDRVQNSAPVTGEGSVQCRLRGDPGVEGGTSRENALEGYSPLNTRDERGGGSPSVPTTGEVGDGLEQDRHRRQVSCDARRTNRVQNSAPITGEGSVQCRLRGDPGVEGGTSRDNALEGYSPLNTRDERGGGSPRVPTTGEVGDGLEQDGHRRQVPCDARRTKRVQNSIAITGEGGVHCRLQGDPGVKGGTSQDYALEGYSPLNTRDERGGGSPSGQNGLRDRSESRGLGRTGVSDQTTRQYDVQCRGTENKKAEASDREACSGDTIPDDAGKGFGPLRSGEEERSNYSDDDEGEEAEFHDILIIYHKKDTHHLRQFEALCDKRRWTTITKDEFPIGTRHFSQFEAELTNCHMAVALITSNFLGDEMADHEHQTALLKSIERKKQNFLPIIYEEGVELPSYLGVINCGEGYTKGFEKKFVQAMKRVKRKHRQMNSQLSENRLGSVQGEQQDRSRQASPKPPPPKQDVPAMFRSLQGQLSPGPHAQRFFRDGRFRELCMVLDLCDHLETPYWYKLAEHIGFNPQDIQWLNQHGRCAANVLEVYCCKHSEEDQKLVLGELREILNRLDYIQAGGIVGKELESPLTEDL